MRRLIAPLILVVLFVSIPASAGKVGFVDAERAVVEVQEAKQKFEELRAWQSTRQGRLDGLRERVLALREQLARAQESGTTDGIPAIEKNELDARRAFEDARRDYERELEERKSSFLGEIAAKIGAVGADYAKANDYDAVFLKTAQPMVYVAESADLTDLVIELYDQRYPAVSQ